MISILMKVMNVFLISHYRYKATWVNCFVVFCHILKHLEYFNFDLRVDIGETIKTIVILRFQTLYVSNVFSTLYARKIGKRNDHQRQKISGAPLGLISWLWLRHHFPKTPFPSSLKLQSQRFQIPPVWRAFSKSAIFGRQSVFRTSMDVKPP